MTTRACSSFSILFLWLWPFTASSQANDALWELKTKAVSATIRSLVSQDSVLFAGTNLGLYRSINAGKFWSLAANPKLHGLIQDLFVRDGQVVAQTSPKGYWATRDQGLTWEPWNLAVDTTRLTIRSALAVPGGFLVTSAERKGLWRYRQLGLDYAITPSGLDDFHIVKMHRNESILYANLSPLSPFTAPSHSAISNDLGVTWFEPSGPIVTDSRIRSFAVLGRWYFATNETGTLYVSNDSGHTWLMAPPFSGAASNPSSLNLAATSNGLLIAQNGSNMWVSGDSAKTWNLRHSTPALDMFFTFTVVGSALLIAEGSDVFLSRDGGHAWLRRNRVASGISSPSLLYVDGEVRAEANGNRYVSYDTGQTWTPAPQFGLAMAGTWLNRYSSLADSVAFLLSGFYTPDSGKEWVATGRHPVSLGTVSSGNRVGRATCFGYEESSDGGHAWKAQNRIADARSVHDWGDAAIQDLKSQGDTIWLGTEKGLFRKRLGDSLWTAISEITHSVQSIRISGSGIQAVGKSGLQIPLSQSGDLGHTWMTRLVTSPVSTSLEPFHLLPLQMSWLIGTRNGIFQTQNQGQSWSTSNQGLWPGYLPDLAPLQNVVTHQGSLWLTLGRWNAPEGIALYRSMDSGLSWNSFQPTSRSFPEGPAAIFENSFLSCGTRLIFLSGTHLWMSEDQGSTWSHPEAGWPGFSARSAHCSDSLIVAITGPRQIATLEPRQREWREWPLPVESQPDTLESVAVVGVRLFAALGPNLFSSGDGGATWARNAIRCGPELKLTSNGPRLWAASVHCADLSVDGGKTWNGVVDSIVAGSNIVRVGINEIENTTTTTQYLDFGAIHQLVSTRYRSSDGFQWNSNPLQPLALTSLGDAEFGILGNAFYQRRTTNGLPNESRNRRLRKGFPSSDSFTPIRRQGQEQLAAVRLSLPGQLEIVSLTPDGRIESLYASTLSAGLHHIQFNSRVSPGAQLFAKWNGRLIRFSESNQSR
jgi:photosystem II stability/assembly factor-like uncharacterized protein